MSTEHLIGTDYAEMRCVDLAREGASCLGRRVPDVFSALMDVWQSFVDEAADAEEVRDFSEALPGDLVLMSSSHGPAAFHWGVIDEHGRVLHTTRRTGAVAVPIHRLRSLILSILRFPEC